MLRFKIPILKVFFPPQFLVSNPVYAVTVIFVYLLSDKAANADFFQIQYLHANFITPKLDSSPNCRLQSEQ